MPITKKINLDHREFITIVNARTHNLKNVTVKVPKGKITVVTGVSGSGKSSLAFDTLFADSQRRYIESMSSYARQFLPTMDKPDVDEIHGLIPAIAIDQKTASHNPRSTVGTVTEIYDYLRLLFARLGVPHCPSCGKSLQSRNKYEILNDILKQNKPSQKIIVLGRVVYQKTGTHENLFKDLKSKGFTRIRLNDQIYTLDELIPLKVNLKNNIDVVIDRLVIPQEQNADEKRLLDAVEQAILTANGEVIIHNLNKNEDVYYSTTNACTKCSLYFPKLEPNLFSFNSPRGACQECQGLGRVKKVPIKGLYDPKLSLEEGGLFTLVPGMGTRWFKKIIMKIAKHYKFSTTKALNKLPPQALKIFFYGLPEDSPLARRYTFKGIVQNLIDKYHQTDSPLLKKGLAKYIFDEQCSNCQGSGVNAFSLQVTLKNYTLLDFINMPVEDLIKMMGTLKFTGTDKVISDKITQQLVNRLGFLQEVGLGYLTLARRANTLSGGESQRVRLGAQLGTGLTGVLYVLDEPSIGLHMRDVNLLVKTLTHLRDLGNTVVVVEHDLDIIKHADHVIEIGPLQGKKGGNLVFSGSYKDFIKCKDCLTPRYLNNRKKIKKSTPASKKITLTEVSHHNLKNVSVDIPIRKLSVITGVSGSGKSSLIFDTLYPALKNYLYKTNATVGKHAKITNLNKFKMVVHIDQSPVGTSPRSIPATYVDILDKIRTLFAATKESTVRGYKIGHFSFNTRQGQCPKCRGKGQISVEMLFMPNLYIKCDLCSGRRYQKEICDIDFNGKNIAQILSMTVQEALEFFEYSPAIMRRLTLLQDVGLEYLKLGQPSTTLSGGESQRLKLAKELSKNTRENTIYLLDEPTIGLHSYDITKLVATLRQLLKKKATIVIIEHNPDMIREADWVIDMGPEGGEKGGQVMYQGDLVGLMKKASNYTAQYLASSVTL